MVEFKKLQPEDQAKLEAHLSEFTEKLAHLAQQHLDSRLKRRIDGDDIVQSAFRTFLRRNAQGRFQLDDTAQLWKLLVHITILKARAKGRFHVAGRRDIHRELGDADEWLTLIAVSDPNEADAIMLLETVEGLLNETPSWYATVLEMRLDDYSATEIAQKLSLSRQSVHRALRVLRDRLEQQLAPIS